MLYLRDHGFMEEASGWVYQLMTGIAPAVSVNPENSSMQNKTPGPYKTSAGVLLFILVIKRLSLCTIVQ